MHQPSKKALRLAEELMDHVSYGLTRGDVLREWAEMIDESDAELVQAAGDLVRSADRNQGVPDAECLEELRRAVGLHQPSWEQAEPLLNLPLLSEVGSVP